MMAAQSGTDPEKIVTLFRRCLTRPPTHEEADLLLKFYMAQRERFDKKELDAKAVAGMGDSDLNTRAAWTVVARSLLNLDETVTKR